VAWAQTPPNEPADFTINFSIVRIPAAGAGPVGDGTVFPGVIFPNGAQSGIIFEDFTNKRVRLNFFAPDGVTVASAQFQFFDKQLQYTYQVQANTCTKTTLTQTFHWAFEWVSKAAHVWSTPSADVWAMTTSPGHLIELGVGMNNSLPPVLLRWQDFSFTTEMRLTAIHSGQPDASVFSLPAACAI